MRQKKPQSDWNILYLISEQNLTYKTLNGNYNFSIKISPTKRLANKTVIPGKTILSVIGPSGNQYDFDLKQSWNTPLSDIITMYITKEKSSCR